MPLVMNNSDPQVSEILQQLSIDENICVTLSFQPGEPLHIEKNGTKVTLIYGRRVELFRGLGLLAENSGQERYSTCQPARFKMDGMMLDCSRNGVMKLSVVKKFIRYMALMGLDTLMLYTEDTYEVPEYPYFGYMRGRYSAQELKEMDDYAASYGIELIPCIQTLAHLDAALRWPCFDEIRDFNNILLCGEEKTYTFIEAMIRACRNCFRTKRIHIGMDEAHMMGLGKYLDRNGYHSRPEIFCNHLNRVYDICAKYDFKPMIWSDMFFRLAFQGAYYNFEGKSISENVINMVPENVELVYWDYYQEEQKHYAAMIGSHQKFHNNTIFAGGAWRWLGHGPALIKSLHNTRQALAACLEKGLEEVFCTAWGDDGSEASFMLVLPVMQQYAEFCYQGDVPDEVLAKRLLTCIGESFQDILLADLTNNVDRNHWLCSAGNPSKYLLYMDVFGGLAEKHTYPDYPQRYEYAAKVLSEAAARSPGLGYMFDLLSKLSGVLAIKSRVGVDAQNAYKADDREKLKEIADVILPELLNRMEKFRQSMYVQWMTECKANGFEVLDQRVGGLEARIKTCTYRLRAYLNGQIDRLEELDEERLSMDCRSDEQVERSEIMCNNFWKQSFSAGVISMI